MTKTTSTKDNYLDRLKKLELSKHVFLEPVSGKVYDLDKEEYEWLQDYEEDPMTLQFILSGMSKE